MKVNKIENFQTIFIYLLSTAIISIIVVEIILGLTPPIARDALIHHLAIPKLWLRHGGFYEIKWADFSYNPMNVDLLYLIPLYFNKDFLANFIHMGFGIGTSWLLYCYLNNNLGRLAGILGVFIFLSTPIVMRMSTVAYVDLGLTFFTTASILAFLRWRDGEYKENKWLVVSAIAMGLALGTKYNALIAWFFVSLAIVFLYSRDTEKQGQAIKYGIIFFFVSLVVFSPWLIKNFILTGNPLYPLFNGFFQTNISNAADERSRSIVSGGAYMGLFKMREMMYGENFFETLLIPVRFFFQGQDYSPRYFDGVLNPILIIFVPFAFMKRSLHDEKLFFLLFSVFFILAAFFLDQSRIRYILPVIPFLAILTVMGIMNIFAWTTVKIGLFKYLSISVLLLLLLMLEVSNFVYLNKYFRNIQPIDYVLHRETRNAYLQRHVGSYAAIRYINDNTPADARIRLLFLARRGYYLDRHYKDDATFGMNIVSNLVNKSGDDKSFTAYLNNLGYTHFLINMDLFHQFLQQNYPPNIVNQLLLRMSERMSIIFFVDGYAVYKLNFLG